MKRIKFVTITASLLLMLVLLLSGCGLTAPAYEGKSKDFKTDEIKNILITDNKSIISIDTIVKIDIEKNENSLFTVERLSTQSLQKRIPLGTVAPHFMQDLSLTFPIYWW